MIFNDCIMFYYMNIEHFNHQLLIFDHLGFSIFSVFVNVSSMDISIHMSCVQF